MIHGSGQTDLTDDLAIHPGLASAGRAALATGVSILFDARMVAMGITAGRLPADNDVLCFLTDRRSPTWRASGCTTRTAAAVSLWEPHLEGAVVAIGNAPTALFHLLEMLIAGAPRPAAIVGCPVGSIGARESKDALIALADDHGIDVPYATVRGRRGGSAMASSAVNALAQEAEGLSSDVAGPLLRRRDRARRSRADHPQGRAVIGAADVVAFHAGVRKQSHARRIATDVVPADAIEEELRYPVTTGTTDHPGGYVGALADFYDECDARVTAHLEAGRDVVLLAEGDPLFFGSSMYLVDRLKDRFVTEVVPGVPAFTAATAGLAQPLVRQTDVLTVLAGTLPEPELARRLADTDGAVIMKLGRTFPAVRSALARAGRLDGAMYVERASMPEERWLPVAEVDPATVPYFSLIVVPGDSARRRARAPCGLGVAARLPRPSRWSSLDPRAGRAPGGRARPRPVRLADAGGGRGAGERRPRGRLRAVRQPGPAARGTPAARIGQHGRGRASAVRPGPGPGRRTGGGRVRRRCGRLRDGVGGVRGGGGRAVRRRPIRVVPGVSAIQAVAARAGAPIGADFAVVSLSDRLKPWSVIEQRLRAIAEADLVLGIYNPASRSRRDQVVAARSCCSSTGPPTPWSSSAAMSGGGGVARGHDAGRAGRRVRRHEVPVAHRSLVDPGVPRRRGVDAAVGRVSARITVVGIGADGWAGLGEDARGRVLAAEVLLGGERHLGLVPPVAGQERRSWPRPLTGFPRCWRSTATARWSRSRPVIRCSPGSARR